MKKLMFMMLMGCSTAIPPTQPPPVLEIDLRDDECGLLTGDQCREWEANTTKAIVRNSNVQMQEFFNIR